MEFIIRKTTADDFCFADEIVKEMEESAKIRGTGIAKRSQEYIKEKMEKGDAVIAITHNGIWAGFCYIETWTNGDYASNSGLIVSPRYRNIGLASRIKESVFNVTREKYPNAKLFGITTGLAVMKLIQGWVIIQFLFRNLLKMISFGMVAKVVSIILFYKAKAEKIVSAQECYSFHQKKKIKEI